MSEVVATQNILLAAVLCCATTTQFLLVVFAALQCLWDVSSSWMQADSDCSTIQKARSKAGSDVGTPLGKGCLGCHIPGRLWMLGSYS